MAQHLLQSAYVNSVPHAVNGKRMPKRVWMDVPIYQCPIFVYNCPYPLLRDREYKGLFTYVIGFDVGLQLR